MTKPIIPEAALKNHTAIVAMTGGGKSYLARGIVEGLLDEERRVCIIDYTGVWYGLRSTASGKRAAYPVVIFGGERADVPLNEHAGPSLAKIVASGNRPCIIDVDGMTVGAQQRFVTAFLEELYRTNTKPLHLVIEEVDEFAPQTGAPGAERMIGAVCRIFQRGRRKGFRAIAITQRPANVHKRVLTQCKTLIALQLNAPQDRGAILDWIRGHADLETGKAIVDDLPKLQLGEGYVWAPQQKILEKVQFPKIRTFDSMRAPEDGEDPEPASWAEVDLAGVKAELAAVVKEAEANDPKLLKAELARLRADLAKKQAVEPAADPKALIEAENRGYGRGAVDAFKKIQPIADRLSTLSGAVSDTVDGFLSDLRRLAGMVAVAQVVAAPAPRQHHATAAPAPASARVAPRRAPSGNGASAGISKVARCILTVLAQRQGQNSTRGQLAVLSGYSVTSSTFANGMSELRIAGSLSGRGDQNAITEAGLAALGSYDPLPTGDALRQWWKGRLDLAERTLLEAICAEYPKTVSKPELASLTNYSETSSTFANALSGLRVRELITRGEIKASDTLFE